MGLEVYQDLVELFLGGQAHQVVCMTVYILNGQYVEAFYVKLTSPLLHMSDALYLPLGLI